MIIYMLNIEGEVMYGECMAEDYARVADDASGRGMSISIVEEVHGNCWLKCPVTNDVIVAALLS